MERHLGILLDQVCQSIPPAAQNQANRRHLQQACTRALVVFQTYCQEHPTTDPVEQQARVQQFQTMTFHLTNDFHQNLHEINTRAERDGEEIRGAFLACPRPLKLTSIELSDGETHRGGHKVCRLIFNNNLQCLYKPRDIRIDQSICSAVGFQTHQRGTQESLLALTNRLAARDIFPTYRFLAKPSYGYVEYLPMQNRIRHLILSKCAPTVAHWALFRL